MDDVVIVGAGPAGAVAATVLARAGVRVRLFDRAAFPRDKLCGDTLNPGTLAMLRRLGLASAADTRGLRVDGMIVTGDGGVRIDETYPDGLFGRAIVRRELDTALVEQAVAAGASFEPSTVIRRALVDGQHAPAVCGVAVGTNATEHVIRAKVVVAADGRRSTIAFGLGLARHPARPRRWAIGAYFDNVTGLSSRGEMHVRRGRYIGVAPVPGGLANVCLVQPWAAAEGPLGDPEARLRREIARDAALRDRFAGARLAGPPVVLGPLAVDADPGAMDGLLLAGDAAGFIDPMTGDGLRFAVRGGELAAVAALRALEHGWAGVHAQLADDRRREFSGKRRFNRALRAMVGSAAAVRVSGQVAAVAPFLVRAIVRRAGDCALAVPA
jgi:flavin-dependent dehydrogenase